MGRYLSPVQHSLLYELEDTALYAGLLLAPVEGFGFFCPLRKKRAFHADCAYLRPFFSVQ